MKKYPNFYNHFMKNLKNLIKNMYILLFLYWNFLNLKYFSLFWETWVCGNPVTIYYHCLLFIYYFFVIFIKEHFAKNHHLNLWSSQCTLVHTSMHENYFSEHKTYCVPEKCFGVHEKNLKLHYMFLSFRWRAKKKVSCV